jgi:enoyl-CoA hydratase
LEKEGLVMEKLILRQDSDGICTLTLNRPEHLNALNLASFRQLDLLVNQLAGEADRVHCVILRGAGRSFCAGADLKDRESGDAIIATRAFKGTVIKNLANLPMPVIAAVHGHCMTGGLEFALAADIIIAAESAIFADTHGKWGLVSSWGLTQRLPRRIGLSKAKEMMFSARRYSARQVERMGLINSCVPDAELESETLRLAQDISRNSAHTNRSYKALLQATSALPLDAGLAWEFHNHPGSAPDVQDRIAAFKPR